MSGAPESSPSGDSSAWSSPAPLIEQRNVAAVLSVGDELLLGQQLDTNAAWLSRALTDLGWSVEEHRTVADDRRAITEALRWLGSRCGAIVVTGGLGPTLDDLTREALGDLTDPGQPLLEDPAGLRHLESWFTQRGRSLAPSNLRQALRPPSAVLLENPFGTAPGLQALWHRPPPAGSRERLCRISCLPGPPREMQPMFERFVAPELAAHAAGLVHTATVAQIGLGESVAAERLGSLMERSRAARGLPTVGTTASGGVVKARIRIEAPRTDGDRSRLGLDEVVAEVERAWHPYAFGRDETTIVDALVALLRSRELSLAVAESCTGGLLGAMLVDLPGVSDCFRGGFITYSNDLKTSLLHVPRGTLATHGAVSRETALAMVEGCLTAAGSACAIAITGVAGPDGGSAEKPAGTVYIAVAAPPSGPGDPPLRRVRRFLISGTRRDVRERAAALSMQMLRLELLGHGDAPLLWELPS